MDKQLETRLKLLVSFPSPPGVAQQIILLANDPNVQISAVAQTISSDPGLAAKVLRIANSALYARRRRSDNLRQALTALGLGAVTTLALGFSIAPFFRKGEATGLDYNRCWRRALMGALAARTLGERIRIDRTEDLFLAGLMQDLGMLALDRAKLGFYAAMPIGSTHDEACKYEIERLGADHAVVGSWLLKEWRLPDLICSSIAASHAPETADGATESGRFTRCLGMAGAIADFFLSDHRDHGMAPLEAMAKTLLGLDAVETSTVIATIVDLLPDVEKLFDTQLMDTADMQSLVDQARELLTLRSLESLEKVTDLEAKASELEQRTEILQDQTRQDALTRVYNRGHLEKVLAEEFAAALANAHAPQRDLHRFGSLQEYQRHLRSCGRRRCAARHRPGPVAHGAQRGPRGPVRRRGIRHRAAGAGGGCRPRAVRPDQSDPAPIDASRGQRKHHGDRLARHRNARQGAGLFERPGPGQGRRRGGVSGEACGTRPVRLPHGCRGHAAQVGGRRLKPAPRRGSFRRLVWDTHLRYHPRGES